MPQLSENERERERNSELCLLSKYYIYIIFQTQGRKRIHHHCGNHSFFCRSEASIVYTLSCHLWCIPLSLFPQGNGIHHSLFCSGGVPRWWCSSLSFPWKHDCFQEKLRRQVSGMFRHSASLVIPHRKSFTAIPSDGVSLKHLGHTNRNVSVSHESQRDICLLKTSDHARVCSLRPKLRMLVFMCFCGLETPKGPICMLQSKLSSV